MVIFPFEIFLFNEAIQYYHYSVQSSKYKRVLFDSLGGAQEDDRRVKRAADVPVLHMRQALGVLGGSQEAHVDPHRRKEVRIVRYTIRH